MEIYLRLHPETGNEENQQTRVRQIGEGRTPADRFTLDTAEKTGKPELAAALPKGRSPDARAKLEELIAEAQRTGIVQQAIDAKAVMGVSVAPK